MLTAKGAFVLSSSLSTRELLGRIDAEIRIAAKSGKFHVKQEIDVPYAGTAITKVLEQHGYKVNSYSETVSNFANSKDTEQWIRISWGQAL